METLAFIAMLAGIAWAAAGLIGYPGVAWKPGAAVAILGAVWLAGHHSMAPEVIEACAVAIFLVLLFARRWVFTNKDAGKSTRPGPG